MGWEQRYKLVALAVKEGVTVPELIASRRAEGKSERAIARELGVARNAVRFWEKKEAAQVIPEISK
jgi:hypothetical protein